jgi:hypothetical protein
MPESELLSEIKLKVNVLVYLVGTLIQTVKTIGVLAREDWQSTLSRVQQLLKLVQKPSFKKSLMSAHAHGDQASESVEADLESRDRFEVERQVYPSLSNFAECLHDQLWKSFQNASHSSVEYLQRIQDENKLLFLCDDLLTFFRNCDQNEYQSRVAVIKLIYIYYKNDSIYKQIQQRW